MARINFTSEVEEIIGKYAGSIFQDSYFGTQVRGMAKPRNPQTQLQQLRRGDFRFLSSSWRALTLSEHMTWVTEAGSYPAALRLFVGSNINRLLIGLDIARSFVSDVTPQSFAIAIVQFTAAMFTIVSIDTINVVPVGTRLLIYATPDRPPTHNFNSPSDFQPIAYFTSGYSFAAEVDILPEWSTHYGLLNITKKVCLKSVLINESNGARGAESITCTTTPPPATSNLIDADGTSLIDSDNTFITAL